MSDSARVDALFEQMEVVRGAMRDLCERCRAARTVYEMEEYWGARCRRPVTTCPADLEPGAWGCVKAEPYEALEKRLTLLTDELRGVHSRRGGISPALRRVSA